MSRVNSPGTRTARAVFCGGWPRAPGCFARRATLWLSHIWGLLQCRQLGGYKDLRILEDLDVTQRLRRVGRTIIVRVPMHTSGRRFLTRGPWRTFFFIVWLLLLHTLRLDTQQYAERWRGPADSPPGSSWRSGHLRNTVKPTHDGGC